MDPNPAARAASDTQRASADERDVLRILAGMLLSIYVDSGGTPGGLRWVLYDRGAPVAVVDKAAEMLDDPSAIEEATGPTVDDLRQLVHDLWAAWNDGTIELHNLLIARGDAPDLPTLDLDPRQQALLDDTIRWVHGHRVGHPHG
jgi:hypothetical protein